MSDKPKKYYDKTYPVRLTEKEMAAIGHICTAYFNRLTAAKQTIPVEIADHLTQALYKMKHACEGKAVITLVPPV